MSRQATSIPISSRAVIESFLQAKNELDATIFMVTHDSFAASFCDRVVILRDLLVWQELTNAGNRQAFQDKLLDTIREMGEVINEGRKSETVRLVPTHFGWLGIVLIVTGCFLGYMMPGVFIRGLKWYPPEGLTSIFYLPALAGLYMVLLHTVVNGWWRVLSLLRSTTADGYQLSLHIPKP